MEMLRGPKAQKVMNRRIKKYVKVMLHEREQIVQINKHRPKQSLSSQRELREEEEDCPCRQCEKTFLSKAALGAHNFQMHGNFCEACNFAVSTTCFACLGQYHSRERLVQYLQWGSMDCLERIKKMVEPLTREQIVYLNCRDKEQYRECRRQGRKHANQTKTFCRGNISDITDIAGNWDEFFAREGMNDAEKAELEAVEKWMEDGLLLELFEQLPDATILEKILNAVEKMAYCLDSAKVILHRFALL